MAEFALTDGWRFGCRATRSQMASLTQRVCYTYRSSAQPKSILLPPDGRWFRQVLQEAEQLWTSAEPLEFSQPAPTLTTENEDMN
jgi:hypothetical protein